MLGENLEEALMTDPRSALNGHRLMTGNVELKVPGANGTVF